VVRTGIPEDRILGRDEFDRLVAGTSRRTSLFVWFRACRRLSGS